jgi:hypothetical protein
MKEPLACEALYKPKTSQPADARRRLAMQPDS